MNDFVDLHRLINVMIRRWWWLVILAIVGCLGGYGISQRETKVYRSTTTLMVGQSIFANQLDRQDILANDLVASSYQELIRREPVMQAVVDNLQLNRTWQSLKKQVQVDLIEGTQMIQVSVEAGDPEVARIIAEEVARQTIQFDPVTAQGDGGDDTQTFVKDQIDRLQARIEDGNARLEKMQVELLTTESTDALNELQKEISTLEGLITSWESTYSQLLTYQQSGQLPNRVSIIEHAQANPRPVRPQVRLYILVGGAVGFFLALGLIFLLEVFDDNLRYAEDITREFGLPVLGSIRNMGRSRENSIGFYVSKYPRSPIAESFRMLRENLESISTDPTLKTILVTSCNKGVGKSSISTNLAIIMAQKDREVVLLDADLRNSSVHELLKLPNVPGLSEILEGGRETSAALQPFKSMKVSVLTAGTPPENPAELLGSPKMDEVLETLREKSDAVIIDAPPLYVSDALALSHRVDGVLLVVHLGSTSRKLVRRTMEQINWAGARVIGVVLNRTPGAGDVYYGVDLYSSYGGKDTNGSWRPEKIFGFRSVKKLGAGRTNGTKGQGSSSTSLKDIGGQV